MESESLDSRCAAPNAARRRAWAGVCVVVYLGLCGATAFVWEPEHDEGVTWTQAFGRVSVPMAAAKPSPANPPGVPIESLYSVIGANPPHSAQAVLDALMVRGGMHPPAYYLLLNGWSNLVGTQRGALGLPAYGVGVLSLFGIARLAARLAGGPAAGRAAMLMLALSPWFLGFSTLARPYALAVAASIWSTVALLELQRAQGRAGAVWRSAFVSVSVLGLYCIYHYLFLFVWQAGLALLLAAQTPKTLRRPELAKAVAMIALPALAFSLWLPNLLVHLDLTGSRPWYFTGAIAPEHWPALLLRSLRVYALGESARAVGAHGLRTGLVWMGAATALLAVCSFGRSGRESLGAAERTLWIASPILPIIVIAADAVHGTHTLFLTRQCFFLFPFLLVLVVRAWQVGGRPLRRMDPLLRRTGTVSWVALLLCATGLGFHTRMTSTTAYEAVARELASADDPAHLLVLSSDQPGYVVPLLLSLRSAGARQLRVVLAPGQRVYELVDRKIANAEEGRVSLVNFAIAYDRDQMWGRRLQQRLIARAGNTGWQVVRWSPGSSLGTAGVPPPLPEVVERGRSERSLWIISPVPVKHFNMEALGVPMPRRG